VSNLETAPVEAVCAGHATAGPVHELMSGRDVVLGGTRGMAVTRTLPNRDRRMVGAWCFLDAYGPQPHNMRVPPHPHTGLQTVSWLLAGELLHRDSLGSAQLIRPGQLNLMTAGEGIAHSEESTVEAVLHGVQLWVALPEQDRLVAPAFAHHPDLPVVAVDRGVDATVLIGQFAEAVSPAWAYTPIVGAEVTVDGDAGGRVPLERDFEYAVLAMSGGVDVDGVRLAPGPLLYLGTGRADVPVRGRGRLLLLGGEPFEEQIVMWWNFVGRSHDEIVADREDWMVGWRFGPVLGYDGDPLPAPELPTTQLKPRGRQR
jgi:redox-sensitive bicupin YhaK (pirin superfamily)